MRLSSLILIGAVCCATAPVQAAGLQLIDVPPDSAGAALTGAVWSPCAAAPAQEMNLHSIAVQGAPDCPVAGSRLPLIVISHGRTAWFVVHHDTAASLADAGFVVVAISHPGDNAFDMSRVDELSIALTRPADVKRAIDFMLGAWPHASKIDGDRIGFFGFSRGGYTGLAVIGGNPNFTAGAARCAEQPRLRACELFRKNEMPEQAVTHDPRIKAAVIADPGFTFLFGPADLKAVRVPVQLWSSEHGGDGVTPRSVAAIGRMLASSPDYRLVPNAGHFAFLAPCSPAQANAIPRICVDAPGFDRVEFHKEFNAEVLAFFRKHLVDTGTR